MNSTAPPSTGPTSTTTSLACHPDHTSVVDTKAGQCVCWSGFEGVHCDKRIEWWPALMIPFFLVELIGLSIVFLCVIVRLYYGAGTCCGCACVSKSRNNNNKNTKMSQRRRGKRSSPHTRGLFVRLVLACMLVGTGCQIVFDLMPSASLFGQPQSVTVTGVKALVTYLCQIFWITATLLITGFWYDALRMKTHRITISNKLILILAIGQFLMAIVCSTVLLMIGSDLISLPLDIAVLLCIALVAYHLHHIRTIHLPSTASTSGATNNNEKRRNYVIRLLFVLLIGGWVTLECLYGIGVLFAFNNLPHLISIVKIGQNLVRVVIAGSLFFLLDYRGRALRQAALSMHLYCGPGMEAWLRDEDNLVVDSSSPVTSATTPSSSVRSGLSSNTTNAYTNDNEKNDTVPSKTSSTITMDCSSVVEPLAEESHSSFTD